MYWSIPKGTRLKHIPKKCWRIRHTISIQTKEQKNDTRKGTLKSVSTPLTTAAGRKLLPDTLNITGRHTSIAVAPADAMGANGLKYLHSKGAAVRVNSSRKILVSKAIVPSSAATCAPREGSQY